MKGLMRNNFYSMGGNIKIAFILSAALIFTPFLIKEPKILSMIISIQIFLFIANVGTSLQADEVAKWNKFELTLPVNRSTVIMAKYISFCILIFLGFMMSIFTVIVVGFSEWSWNINSIVRGHEYGLTLSIIVAAIMYPTMLKIGTEKNELIILLSAFLSILVMLLIAFVLSPLTGAMNLQSTFVGAVSVVISLLLLIISYFISLRIYKNKEF